jgi:hypothetical protein
MPAFVAGIHVFGAVRKTWMAGTFKPGHDEEERPEKAHEIIAILVSLFP